MRMKQDPRDRNKSAATLYAEGEVQYMKCRLAYKDYSEREWEVTELALRKGFKAGIDPFAEPSNYISDKKIEDQEFALRKGLKLLGTCAGLKEEE